ncbi:MAG: glycosyltransferase family 2 protein [Lachnospiraceae bacterium]|nr:glycosyltransferase family 2 protein [Lachnospiraceae bacterium]
MLTSKIIFCIIQDNKNSDVGVRHGKEVMNNMEDLISIILPVYNVEEYVEECLTSLVHQTYKNIEIIVIDDGSTDKSGAICDEWINKDSRISVYHIENSGVSSARNKGIELSRGKYIGFVDPDDYVHPNYCEFLLDALIHSHADFAVCKELSFVASESLTTDAYELGYHAKIKSQKETRQHFLDDFLGPIAWVWNKLYLREIIGDTRFVPGRKAQDLMFNAELMSKINSTVWLDEKLYFYRQREGSVCAKETLKSILDWMYALDYTIHVFLKSEPLEFQKLFITSALNRMAQSWVMAKGSNIMGHREARKYFLEKCSEYWNLVFNNNTKIKLFIARRFGTLYYLIKKENVINSWTT